MARYGINRARIGALHPETDKDTSKIIECHNPFARVDAQLLRGLANALGCQPILLAGNGSQRVHVFGYESDLERLDVLYTSVLLQMHSKLAAIGRVPGDGARARAWRRSWLLGYAAAVIKRVKDAEKRVTDEAAVEDQPGSKSTALVLVDRSLVIRQKLRAEYPHTRMTQATYSGGGFAQGHAAGMQANLGGTAVGRRTAGAIR
jgi:hypothetical protein